VDACAVRVCVGVCLFIYFIFHYYYFFLFFLGIYFIFSVGGLLPLVPGGPLPYAYGGSVQELPLQSFGWMCGCPCGGLPGFCAPWGLLVAWVLWPSLPASDC